MNCGSKNKFKNAVSCTNTNYDVTDFINHGIVKNIKLWIPWEPNTTFLQNQKILSLFLRWNILKIYYFVAEVTKFLKYENQQMWSWPTVSNILPEILSDGSKKIISRPVFLWEVHSGFHIIGNMIFPSPLFNVTHWYLKQLGP